MSFGIFMLLKINPVSMYLLSPKTQNRGGDFLFSIGEDWWIGHHIFLYQFCNIHMSLKPNLVHQKEIL